MGPFATIVCESCIGFIGGGKSHVPSSSASTSWWADWELINDFDWLLLLYSSSDCFSVGNLNVLSDPFLTSGRSDDVLLSTLPCDSLRSGGGSHLRLKENKWNNSNTESSFSYINGKMEKLTCYSKSIGKKSHVKFSIIVLLQENVIWFDFIQLSKQDLTFVLVQNKKTCLRFRKRYTAPHKNILLKSIFIWWTLYR